jgi:hypothetical protein
VHWDLYTRRDWLSTCFAFSFHFALDRFIIRSKKVYLVGFVPSLNLPCSLHISLMVAPNPSERLSALDIALGAQAVNRSSGEQYF